MNSNSGQGRDIKSDLIFRKIAIKLKVISAKGGGKAMRKMKVCMTMVLVAAFFSVLSGCNKKQQSLEEMQAPMSADSLGGQALDNKVALQEGNTSVNVTGVSEKSAEAVPAATTAALEPLPPSGPYKPSAQDIQTALKNAGFYSGNVDGKIGPKTKAAIEEFQKANGLTADGKVGPKTWAALEKYLTSTAGAQSEQTVPLQ